MLDIWSKKEYCCYKVATAPLVHSSSKLLVIVCQSKSFQNSKRARVKIGAILQFVVIFYSVHTCIRKSYLLHNVNNLFVKLPLVT